jgi:hypothetical protein
VALLRRPTIVDCRILQKMRFMTVLLPVWLIACPGECRTVYGFDLNARCQRAYAALNHLRLQEGEQLLEAEKRENPSNLFPYFLDNYVDFFELFFGEDPEEYDQRKDNLDKRLEWMRRGPSSSPFYLFTQSIIRFQWAAVDIKFEAHWQAGWEFRQAFLETKQNQEHFPKFSPSAMLGGALEVSVGTIPEGYRWLASLMGMRGSIHHGMHRLEAFLGQADSLAQLFRDEASFYFLYLQFHIENRRKEVFRYIQDNHLDLVNNELLAYLAVNLGVNDEQCAYARDICLKRSQSAAFYNLPQWDLEMGTIELDHLDPDGAVYLYRFTRQFKGKFYLKEVFQKLSWLYYLTGDQARAESFRRRILESGSTATESDKDALQEARSGQWPDKTLLRARLLNDGGYLQEALAQLQTKKMGDFTRPEERTEYAYRLGRIYDDLGRKVDALSAYLTTIKLGDRQKQYFAARAALQMGCIYEERKDTIMALSYFRKCLSLKDHEYKNSLDQKAKAGIARCVGD